MRVGRAGPIAVAVAALLAVATAAGCSGFTGVNTRGGDVVGDLPGWRHVFFDDFTTNVPLGSFPAKVADRWSAYPSPWTDTSGRGRYAPKRVVSIDDGVMRLHIHTRDGTPVVSAVLPEIPGSSRGSVYGRYAVRWRSDRLPGYKIAWLLWPDAEAEHPGSEIDFPEMNLDRAVVDAFVHRERAGSSGAQYHASTPIDISRWHTSVIEWSPDLVTVSLDGVVVGRTTVGIPSASMHWVLQTETALSGPPPASTVQGDVQIDWVSIWSYRPS